MGKINEMRAQRAKTWEKAKAFLDERRNEKGILSAEDTATYERMEAEIVDLGKAIERQERMDAFERELNAPVGTPITSRPGAANQGKEKGVRSGEEYKAAFWNHLRRRENGMRKLIAHPLLIEDELDLDSCNMMDLDQ